MKVERSKRVLLTQEVGKENLNKESVNYLNKFKISMELKELAKGTITGYEGDLYSWFSYIYLFQNNKSTLEITEDDLTEFFYYCKREGNNGNRMKRRMAPIQMYYKFLRTKRIGRMIDVPTLHPHDFRHSGATLLKDAGMSLEDVSELLNHKSLDTTKQFYIKANEKKIQENKDKFEIKI